jgi:hypothetical protein
MYVKTNIEYWDELLAKGHLFSYVKDGYPDNIAESILGFAYPVELLLIITTCIILMLRLKPSLRRYKTWLFSITTGTILGGTWCCIMQKFDPDFPGWLFAPWSVTGLEFGLSIEDWIFMPASTTLFYVVFRMVSFDKESYYRNSGIHIIILSIYVLLSAVTLIFMNTAGRTEILMFILPAMIFYYYAKNIINIKKFLILQLFIVLFETIWDISAVSLVHSIPGLAWASQWTYLCFDAAGNAYHSSIFMQYSTHKWAWLLLNPVEITPIFGICGGILNYAMFSAGDKYFYDRKYQ